MSTVEQDGPVGAPGQGGYPGTSGRGGYQGPGTDRAGYAGPGTDRGGYAGPGTDRAGYQGAGSRVPQGRPAAPGSLGFRPPGRQVPLARLGVGSGMLD